MTINIILLIFSIGFGKATVLNSIVIFLLLLLLVFMPEKAFDDDKDNDEKFQAIFMLSIINPDLKQCLLKI